MTYFIFASYNGLFANVQTYLYLYIPLLTMGLMSRELGSGSIKLLYSSPITNSQIVLGKYVAMLIYGLVLIGVLAVYAVYVFCVVQNADVTLVLSGLLGIYLLLCVYVAIGLFMSSLTSYQIVAAVGTLAILAALTYVQGMWQAVPFVREITYWFGLSGRAWAFVGGLVSSEDVLYFVVVIALFICMTIIRMQSRRRKVSWTVSFSKYAGIWIVAFVLAYVSSRPVFKFYYDATQMKVNTLTPNSQEIIKRLDGGLTITTYVNILDRFAWVGDHENYISDRSAFEQYIRFKPEIKMKYVYYYDTIQNNFLENMYPGMSYEEKAKKEIERKKLNPKKATRERRDERAAVRRLLMYWGNAERTRTEKERLLISVDEEIEAQYDLHPQQITGLPHGTELPDSTPTTVIKASRELKRLRKKKKRLEDELQNLDHWVGMIEFEVMCLPPLEYEAIRLRYVKYGVAKGGYWERIAQQMHVSIDWAKTLERQGVDRLIGRIAA